MPFQLRLNPTDILSLLAITVSLIALLSKLDQQHSETLSERHRAVYGSYTLGIDYELIWEDFHANESDDAQQRFAKRIKALQAIAVDVGITIPSDAFTVQDLRQSPKTNGSPEDVVAEALQTKYDDSLELDSFFLGADLELLSWYYKNGPSTFGTSYAVLGPNADASLSELLKNHLAGSCHLLPNPPISSPVAADKSVVELRNCLHTEWLGEPLQDSADVPAPEGKAPA